MTKCPKYFIYLANISIIFFVKIYNRRDVKKQNFAYHAVKNYILFYIFKFANIALSNNFYQIKKIFNENFVNKKSRHNLRMEYLNSLQNCAR